MNDQKDEFFSMPIPTNIDELFDILGTVMSKVNDLKQKEEVTEEDIRRLLYQLIFIEEHSVKILNEEQKLDNAHNLNTLRNAIVILQRALVPMHHIEREQENIERGLYEHQLKQFTTELHKKHRQIDKRLKNEYKRFFVGGSPVPGTQTLSRAEASQVYFDKAKFDIALLMDQGGLRCTAAVPVNPPSDPLEPIEIQINFFGTLDFDSQLLDMEKGGPGQESLKRQEAELLRKVNDSCEQISKAYPGRALRLRVSGHSLGGSLAKGFAHALQRAIAAQEKTPEAIFSQIQENYPKEIPPVLSQSLQAQLVTDAQNFQNLTALSQVSGLTLYALGSPGVSKTTDQHAALFTYYQDPTFLRVYNHHHKDDLIVRFGQTEFLAGQNGIAPRIATNKAIIYDVTVSDKEAKKWQSLPFPGVTSKVVAIHNEPIYKSDKTITTKVLDLGDSPETFQKAVFSKFRQALLEAAFLFMRFAACFKPLISESSSLYSYPPQRP